jgi:hypothetical protein
MPSADDIPFHTVRDASVPCQYYQVTGAFLHTSKLRESDLKTTELLR